MWPSPDWTDPRFALPVTALAGWLWGSFLNQLVDRTPRRRQPTATAPGPPPGVSPWRPARSLCFACGRRIPWHENVPILSYLRLRGRCRACGAPIGRRTLVLETATPLVLLGWHAAVLALEGGMALLAWGLAAASWLLVGAALIAEGRRTGPVFLALGLLLAAVVLVSTASAAP